MTILQELYNLGISNKLFELTDSKGKREKTINGYIVIDEKGTYKRFELLDEKHIIRTYCPTLGNTNGAKNADFLVDCADNILNIESKKHANYVEHIVECAKSCNEMLPYAIFLKEYDSNKELRDEVLSRVTVEDITKIYISVKINDSALENETWWKEWFLSQISLNEPIEILSTITGKPVMITEAKYPAIASGTGVPVFSSCNSIGQDTESAYSAYGLPSLTGSGIGTDEAYVIRDTINYLIGKGKDNHYNYGMIHFCEESIGDEILSKFIDDFGTDGTNYDEQVKKAYNSIYGESDAKFSFRKSDPIMTTFELSFSKGRYFATNLKKYSYTELVKNLYLWNTEDAKCYEGEKRFSVGNIMFFSDVADKKNVRKALINSIISNTQIPEALYKSAVDTYTSSFLKKTNKEKVAFAVAIIKIYLKRRYGFDSNVA